MAKKKKKKGKKKNKKNKKKKKQVEMLREKKSGLLTGNPIYKPFRYPWCYDAWLTQQRIHWLPEEVPMSEDVKDWATKITPAEKNRTDQHYPTQTHLSQLSFPLVDWQE